MKLTTLNAYFLGDHNGRAGVGVIMDCPCGCEHELFVPFDVALDGTPVGELRDGKPWGWKRSGVTLETLTLSPSVQRNEPCPKKWHGWIRDGEAVSC